MKVSIIRPHELDNSQIANWRTIQRTEPELSSPFLCPEFTISAGECLNNVFIGIIEDDTKEVGYFPFQRKNIYIGEPASGRLSDYQAVIIKRNVELDTLQLIKKWIIYNFKCK